MTVFKYPCSHNLNSCGFFSPNNQSAQVHPGFRVGLYQDLFAGLSTKCLPCNIINWACCVSRWNALAETTEWRIQQHEVRWWEINRQPVQLFSYKLVKNGLSSKTFIVEAHHKQTTGWQSLSLLCSWTTAETLNHSHVRSTGAQIKSQCLNTHSPISVCDDTGGQVRASEADFSLFTDSWLIRL